MNKNEYNFEIGELVYSIRKLNGMTQVDFSKKLGVVQSTISKIEKGFFDDVPFSLISKISTIFKIPLIQFQVGFLNIKSASSLKRIIPTNYTKNGEISAKTIYFILSEISQEKQQDIFKKLKLQRQYFCISNLLFNKEFLIKLNEIYPKELEQALKNISINKSSTENSGMVEKYLTNLKSVKIIDTESKDGKTTFTLHLPHLDIHSSQLNEFYSKCFAIDLNLTFQEKITSEFLKTNDNQFLKLEVR